MFKPNDYDLDKEYRQRQLRHSNYVRQVDIANKDNESTFLQSAQVAYSMISQALTPEPKQLSASTQSKFNRRVHAS